jgi:glycosyltransferase involved in cell wall biosynthesis
MRRERLDRVDALDASAVWVVIPAYNEGLRVGRVIDEVGRIKHRVVVVDDGSTDDTLVTVLSHDVWVVRHAVNLGQGAALQTGIDFALARGADAIVTFDADGQHQAADIPRLLDALRVYNADFALGSRFLGKTEGMPWTRKLMLKAAVAVTCILSGTRVSDAHNGFRAMTRRGAERIQLRCNGMEHASEILDQIVISGLTYVEVPVRIRYSADTLAKGQRTAAAFGLGLRLLLYKFAR